MGRPKGSPNKDKDAIVEMLKKHCVGYKDPLIILADVACGQPKEIMVWVPAEVDPETRRIIKPGEYQPRMIYPDLDQQTACAKEVAQYIHAKRKAVEVTGEVETGAQVHFHIPGMAANLAEWNAITGHGKTPQDTKPEEKPQ